MCSALTTQAAFTKRKKTYEEKKLYYFFNEVLLMFGGSWRSASAASAAPFAHNKTKGQLPCMHRPGQWRDQKWGTDEKVIRCIVLLRTLLCCGGKEIYQTWKTGIDMQKKGICITNHSCQGHYRTTIKASSSTCSIQSHESANYHLK